MGAPPPMLHDRLEQVFQAVFNDDELQLRDDMKLSEFAGWDSVGHINLMYSIEETFGVQFAGNELAEFKNIGELKNYLAQHATQGVNN
jgi:acyl carrier protein